jgi:hypothetical protein
MYFSDVLVNKWSPGMEMETRYRQYQQNPSRGLLPWCDALYFAWIEAVKAHDEERVEWCEKRFSFMHKSLIEYASLPRISASLAAHVAILLKDWHPTLVPFSRTETAMIQVAVGRAVHVGLERTTSIMSEDRILLDLVAADIRPRPIAEKALTEATIYVHAIQDKRWLHWACERLARLHRAHRHYVQGAYWSYQAKYVCV